jgi:hypothetical protein
MCRTVLLGVLFLSAGCQGVVGPRQRLAQPAVADDPRLTIPEQESRGRALLALPEPSWNVAPRTFAEQPGYQGRY